MMSYLLIMMIVNIIAAVVISIILTGMELANLMGYDLPCIGGDGKKERDTIIKIRKILKYGMKAIQLPFMIITIIIAAKLKNVYVNNTCSDTYTNT